MDATSRRGFLKLAGLGAMGAADRPASGRPPKPSRSRCCTRARSSRPFDEYMQEDVGAGLREGDRGQSQSTRLTSVGSLPTRISTIAETGSGADVTMIFLLYPFLFAEKLLDVSDIAEEAGKKQGGWYDAAEGGGRRQRQMEGGAVQQYRPADELAHRLVRRGRGQEISRIPGTSSTRSARS